MLYNYFPILHFACFFLLRDIKAHQNVHLPIFVDIQKNYRTYIHTHLMIFNFCVPLKNLIIFQIQFFFYQYNY